MPSERVQRQIDRLLDEAEEAISRYDWEAVREAEHAVLAIDPENADAITYLASAETVPLAQPPRLLHHHNPPRPFLRNPHLLLYPPQKLNAANSPSCSATS